ncbi:MAG: carboxymuconolactone decarboxylase family protein [Gemmataceae bacterium]
MSNSERYQRGLEVLRQMLGPDEAERTLRTWQTISPEFAQYVLEFVAGDIWHRPQLGRQHKSLVTIAVLAALGRPLALNLNLRMALNNGVSRQDIVETLLQIAPYAGFPACWEGLAAAQQVFQEIDAQQT